MLLCQVPGFKLEGLKVSLLPPVEVDKMLKQFILWCNYIDYSMYIGNFGLMSNHLDHYLTNKNHNPKDNIYPEHKLW